MSEEFVEKENRWRLEQLLHLNEQRLQELTREAWDARRPGSPDTKNFLLYQRGLVEEGNVEEWDVSLCVSVLKKLNALAKEEKDAAQAIANARNACAHAVAGRVTSESFESHYMACSSAYEVLGGSADALQQLLASEIDTNDVRVLSCSREATLAAEREKMEGNRLFGMKNYRGAKESYTRGLQIAGAVDSMVQAQLYNNRATASFRLKDFASAKEDAKHAAELAPQWAKPQLRLAEIYYATNKYHKAVGHLERGLGVAKATQDDSMVNEIAKKMPDYLLQRDKLIRRESENLAYGPMHDTEGAFKAANQARFGQDVNGLVERLLKVGLDDDSSRAQQHVLAGHTARQRPGGLEDAAREYLNAAVMGNAEGMYNYALAQLNGRGTRKDIPGAIRWLEKAASAPQTQTGDALQDTMRNCGIGEAMTVLGNFHEEGIHLSRNEERAREYWERAAGLGACTGLNQFGRCLADGSHGVQKDLPRAREMFRRSAELLHNEAMSNLAWLHASLGEYETAARWADSACKFGYPPAAEDADRYRKLAALKESLPEKEKDALATVIRPSQTTLPTIKRSNRAPTLDELRAIDTPYGKRLLAAKEMMVEATQSFLSRDPDAIHRAFMRQPNALTRAVELAAEALRVDDATLVISDDEAQLVHSIAQVQREMGEPINPDLALLLQNDESGLVEYWNSMQRQFPDDLMLTRRAAEVNMFDVYPGADTERGVRLFQRALGLLPHGGNDRDPQTIGLLYAAGAAYYKANTLGRAETLLRRFLTHAPDDGHRKSAEAHFILGLISLMKGGPKDMTAVLEQMEADSTDQSALMQALATAASHFREGAVLLERVPPFLREAAQDSPNRKRLERMLAHAGEISTSVHSTPAATKKWGGELVRGPRRHPELRSEVSMLRVMWRKNFGAIAERGYRMRELGQTVLSSNTQPAQEPSANVGNEFTSATIDELFSALEDRVCSGRMIECIVVSVPSWNHSSFNFVVEDSQREPARIALYNAPKKLIAQLTPGCAFRLLNPYVRLARDGSLRFRVDNPSSTIKVRTQHTICWVCAVEQQQDQALKRCAKCHKATYCSKECQKQDWKIDGHRFLCEALQQPSGDAA